MSNRFGTAVRRLTIVCVVATLGLAGGASATLQDRGPNLVYDDVLNITWTRNANLPGSSDLTWDEAKAWAANLVYAGHDDWRLTYESVSAGALSVATVVDCSAASESACRDNEMGYMFYHDLGGSFRASKTGIQIALGGEVLSGIQASYWSGTGFDSFAAWEYDFPGGGGPSIHNKTDRLSAWAVRAGDVPTIAEPAPVLLIGVGMLGLVTWMRRRAIS